MINCTHLHSLYEFDCDESFELIESLSNPFLEPTNTIKAMRIKFLAQGKDGRLLRGFEPTSDMRNRGWNNLEYRYDGLTMRGTVNGQSGQKSIVGNIVGKSEPLLIGSCGVSNAYNGFLDEFKFYMCNP